MEQRKKQNHNSGYEESRLEPLQVSAWKNSMGYSPGEKRAIRRIRAGLIFKDDLLQAQEWSIPTNRKWSRGGRRLYGWARRSKLNSDIRKAHVLIVFLSDQSSGIPGPGNQKVRCKEDFILMEEDQDEGVPAHCCLLPLLKLHCVLTSQLFLAVQCFTLKCQWKWLFD